VAIKPFALCCATKRAINLGMLFEHEGVGALLGQLGGTAFGVKIRSLFAAILAGVAGGLGFDFLKRTDRALVRVDVGSNHAPLAFDHAGGCQLFADFRHAEVLARGLLLGEELRGLVGTTGHLAQRADGFDVTFRTHPDRHAGQGSDAGERSHALGFLGVALAPSPQAWQYSAPLAQLGTAGVAELARRLASAFVPQAWQNVASAWSLVPHAWQYFGSVLVFSSPSPSPGFLPSAAIVSVSLGILAVTSLVVDLAAIAAVELWTGSPSS